MIRKSMPVDPSLLLYSRASYFLLLSTLLFNLSFKIGITLYLSDFFSALLLTLTLLRWTHSSPPLHERPFRILFLILFAYCLLQIFYAYALLGNPSSAVFGRFKNLFIYPLLFFSGMSLVREKNDLETLINLIRLHVLMALSLGVLSIIVPSLDISKIYSQGKVVDSLYFMLVPHGTALLCGLVFVYELLTVSSENKPRWPSFFFLVISSLGIIGTQNRSILVSFILMVLLVVVASLKGERLIRRRAKKYIAAILLILTATGLAIFSSPIRDRFSERINQTIEVFNGETEFFHTIPGIRIGRTLATYNEWLESPIIGCGWGNQITEFRIYDLQGNYVRTNYGTPHNYYITILYQMGAIGFIIMAFFYFLVFRALRPQGKLDRNNHPMYSVFIFFCGFMLYNLVNTHLYADPVFIPVFMALLGSMTSKALLLRTPSPDLERS